MKTAKFKFYTTGPNGVKTPEFIGEKTAFIAEFDYGRFVDTPDIRGMNPLIDSIADYVAEVLCYQVNEKFTSTGFPVDKYQIFQFFIGRDVWGNQFVWDIGDESEVFEHVGFVVEYFPMHLEASDLGLFDGDEIDEITIREGTADDAEYELFEKLIDNVN